MKKDDKLQQLLKQAGTDQPADDFTQSIMNIIEADAVQETALKAVLKQHPAEGPSFDFTAEVMRQVSAQRKPLVIQPIITKTAWYIIAGVSAVFVLIAFAMSLKPMDVDLTNSNRISSIINKIQVIPSSLVVALVAIAMVLLGDYMINQQKKAVLN